MSHGRLPSTKIKMKKKSFYPSQSCQDCPAKWKGVEKDKNGRVLREMSCVSTCKVVI